jgi:hypothetical protein
MPRQSSPSAGAAGKLQRYRRGLLFARRHSSRGRQARRRGFRGKSRRASGSVGALPRSSTGAATISGNAHDKGLHDVGMLQQDLLDLGATLTPPILIISFSRPRSHLPPPASQRNSIIVSSRQGRARRGSRAKKDCAISARVVPLIVLSRRWGTRY